MSPETAFVLDRFQVEVPRFMDDVRTQIKDVRISDSHIGRPDMSIRETWHQLEAEKVSTLTIVDEEKHLGSPYERMKRNYLNAYNSSMNQDLKVTILENGEIRVNNWFGI